MSSVFLNTILLMFPILCHFLYMIYSKTTLKDENYLFFDLMLLSSFYLYIKFGSYLKYCAMLILFILFLTIYKKRFFSGILLIICLTLFFGNLYQINNYLLLVLFLISFLLGYYAKINIKIIFLIFLLLFLNITIFFGNIQINNSNLIKMLIILLLSYTFFFGSVQNI